MTNLEITDGSEQGDNSSSSHDHLDYLLPYEDFPVNPSTPDDDYSKLELANGSIATPAEVLFSGRQEKGCVCFIDMVNSTKIVDKMTESDLSRYYSTFLNDMTSIILNFGGTLIKNSGDALMYYFSFPDNTKNQQILDVLRDVLDCGITMIAAHEHINTKLKIQDLPPLNYRISSDYGTVTIAKSSTSQNIDLFGSVVNHCAKINSKAPANGMAIGDDLYQAILSLENKTFFDDYYVFERIGEFPVGTRDQYTIYSVQSNPLKNRILNPFTRKSIRASRQ